MCSNFDPHLSRKRANILQYEYIPLEADSLNVYAIRNTARSLIFYFNQIIVSFRTLDRISRIKVMFHSIDGIAQMTDKDPLVCVCVIYILTPTPSHPSFSWTSQRMHLLHLCHRFHQCCSQGFYNIATLSMIEFVVHNFEQEKNINICYLDESNLK